jgi:hypothetical protein
MIIFEASILGEEDKAVLRKWLVGRSSCSLDEWLWVAERLLPDDFGELLF